MITDRERRLLRVIEAAQSKLNVAMIDRALDRLEAEIRAKDASGHEHIGKGDPKGGQFTGHGGGGSGGSESGRKEGGKESEKTHGRKPRAPHKPGEVIKPTVAKEGRPQKVKAIVGEMKAARREGKGKDAIIVMADGSKPPSHVPAGLIPPGWHDVEVSVDPNATLLARGRDDANRVQRKYVKTLETENAVIKWANVSKLLNEYNGVMENVQKARRDPLTKEEADCLWLIAEQGTRPGSESETGAKIKAYGATTLQAQHVRETKEGLMVSFMGKEATWHDHLIENPELAKMLRERADSAPSPQSKLFETNDRKLRKFTADQDSGKFAPKDFRTHRGTKEAKDLVMSDPRRSKNAREHQKRVMEVAEKVSIKLGNKPAMALEKYIDPSVFAAWEPANA